MKEITLIRSNVNEFWGFRLEDRKQENQPLVIRQVVSNSSADGKLNDGDILLKIFDKNAENLSFAEAISLIRRTPQCLNLTVRSSNEFHADSFQNFTLNSESMNRRFVVPQENPRRHSYVTPNPNQPFSYTDQLPSSPRKNIQYDTDAITQSPSFQFLQGWISESERSFNQSSSNFDSPSFTEPSTKHRANFTLLPSRSFRHLHDQYKDKTTTTLPKSPSLVTIPNNGLRKSSDSHTPSRSFKFLQDQYPANGRDDLMEIYNRTPPSFREREPETPCYSGSKVPSRSFRYLQQMTGEIQSSS